MRVPAFVGQTYQSSSINAAQQDVINWFPETIEDRTGPEQVVYYPTPGVELLDSSQGGPGRAHFSENGREWAVIGNTFGEVSSAGVFTSKGTVAVDSNPATISSNGDGGGELFVTSGGNGYIYDLDADTLTQITALDGKADMGDYLDGYFLALDRASSTLYLSDLLDGTTWDPTQFAQRSRGSDPWTSMKVVGTYVFLLGTETSEVWFNAGSFPFPFEPHPSGLLSYGCAAPFSPAIVEGSLCWLASTRTGEGMVLRTQGFSPGRISTHPIQTALQSFTHINDAVGDSYEDNGHTFYLLSIPAAGITYAWDAATALWAKRGTWIAEDRTFVSWRPRFHAFEFGEHRWLDSETGSLYRSDVGLFYDVDSRPIRRVRRAPAVDYELERIKHQSFELNMEVGVGTHQTQEVGVPASLLTGATTRVYYEFEGDGADVFGGSDLTAVNDPSYTEGAFNQGALLAASSSQGFSGSVSGVIADDPWTFSARVKLDSLSANMVVFQNGFVEEVSAGGVFFITQDGALAIGGTDDLTDPTASTETGLITSDGQFHCVGYSLLLDEGEVSVAFYLDGVNVGEAGTGGSAIAGGTIPFTIGYSPGPDPGPLDGVIDSVVWLTGRIWDDDEFLEYCTPVGVATNPSVMLRWSDDGGHQWSHEHWRRAGKVGEYLTRVRWNRLGQARRRVYEVAVSDAVPWKLIDAYIEVPQAPRRIPQDRRSGWDA